MCSMACFNRVSCGRETPRGIPIFGSSVDGFNDRSSQIDYHGWEFYDNLWWLRVLWSSMMDSSDGFCWWESMITQPLSDGFPAIVCPTKTEWRSGLAGQGFRRIFGQIHQAGRQGTLTIKLWRRRRRRISYISCISIYIYYVYRENEKDVYIYIYTVETSLYDIIWYHSMSMSVYIYIVCLVQYTVLQSIAMQSNAKCKSKQFVNVMYIILHNANVMYCKVCIVSYRMVLYGTVRYGMVWYWSKRRAHP